MLQAIKPFAKWVCDKLGIEDEPKVVLSNNLDQVKERRTFGSTQSTGEIWVYVGKRNTADVMRTLAHELVHFKQFSIGTAHDSMDKKQNLKIEDEANAIAGRLMRKYGKLHSDIYEGRTGSIQDDVAKALPATYAIPGLKNQDPYLQYRFGVAIAGAKGASQRAEDNVAAYQRESEWGENEIIVSYGMDMDNFIDDALKQMGLSGKKRLSTIDSEETTDVGKNSPLIPFKGYGK